MVDQYAVFGNPVAQSLSPRIHHLFAEQTSQELDYGKQCPDVNGFVASADAFFQAGGCGLNVTAPFKLDAFNYASHLSEGARRAGAVNTLIRASDSSIHGDNTDGRGLVNDICQNLSWSLLNKRVLLLGAGGASRGVLAPLLAKNPAFVVVANRTPEKATQLATAFAKLGAVHGCGFGGLSVGAFDIIINATSAGLMGQELSVPDAVLAKSHCCYDMTYGATDTAFVARAKAVGVPQLSDGLGMLVGQAAESFYLWRGIRPDVAPVIKALRAQIAA